ncbi:nucleotidyltransferase domain-containing protein [Candidatus Uhrbacteria bacterium]|nr:nucleotidyltransferase domain-containing protein [Candidatus Uhrbacteria bacterium]
MKSSTKKIVQELKRNIESKYRLNQLVVFGSSARGDSSKGSDIDVWVCLNELDRHIEEDLFDMAYDMELKYDCLIDLLAVSEKDLKGQIGKAPIQKNILSEGVAV